MALAKQSDKGDEVAETPQAPPSPGDLLKPLATRGLLTGLIVGIFALSKPPLVLASLGVCIAIFVCLVCLRPLHRVTTVTLANFAFWVASGLITGGLALDTVHSKDFWRGEGRCFLFYLPLVAMSFMAISKRDLRFLVRLVCLLTVVGMIMCALWLVGLGGFQAEVDPETGEKMSSEFFIGLLTSHTGAGAFWATVAAFLAGYSLITQERSAQGLAVMATLLTLGTGGRAATIGMIACIVWLLVGSKVLTARAFKFAIPVGVVLVALGWALAYSVPRVGERIAELFDDRTIQSVVNTLEEPGLRRASGFFYSGVNLEHHNLVIRVFLWKYALRLFGESPLIGVGYGRFNDPNLEFAGIPHVLYLAVDGDEFASSGIQWEGEQLMVSTGNAHNSYLHMLAETGVIGLALMLYLWYLMYHYCSPHAAPEVRNDVFLRGYCLGCQAAIVCLMATALPGHALAAPSGGILLTTLVGSWLGYRSYAYAQNQLKP